MKTNETDFMLRDLFTDLLEYISYSLLFLLNKHRKLNQSFVRTNAK